jgi:dolichol-phosphate mannosyltransferase
MAQGQNISSRPDISIVIPARDEEENVAPLAVEVGKVMGAAPWSWECLWIDDGSKDLTLTELARIHKQDPRHRCISLDGNFGQAAALYTGFLHARGKLIATLDGDGQNDPADIPRLVKLLIEENAHMVNGQRKKRRDNLVRRISSLIANGFRNWFTNENIHDVGCSTRVFRHECVERIPLFKGMHRFLPTLVRMAGFTHILEVPVGHRPRRMGQTKYGIHDRLWVGILDTLGVRWLQVRAVKPKIKSSTIAPGGKE